MQRSALVRKETEPLPQLRIETRGKDSIFDLRTMKKPPGGTSNKAPHLRVCYIDKHY